MYLLYVAPKHTFFNLTGNINNAKALLTSTNKEKVIVWTHLYIMVGVNKLIHGSVRVDHIGHIKCCSIHHVPLHTPSCEASVFGFCGGAIARLGDAGKTVQTS